MRTRPNILFIHSDSMDGRTLGCMGHPAASTPVLDRLAERGTLYANTYCPSPLCVPSRVATWTGRHSHRYKVWNNACGRPDDTDTFLPLLEQAGYRVHAIGRDDRYAGGHSFSGRLKSWTRAANICAPPANPGPRIITDPDAGQRVRTRDWHATDEAIAWLIEQGGDSGDQPFFLSLGHIAPHPGQGYRSSPYYLDRIDPASISLPPRDHREHPVMHAMRINKGYVEMTDEQIIDLRRHYLAMNAEVDEQIGLVLDTLERTGLAASTIVIYFSDHGDMQMEHGQWRKCSMFESSVRVPLIVAGPDVPANMQHTEPTSLLDLYPTVLEIAGVDERTSDGVSLLHCPSGANRAVYAQYHESLQPTGSFMIRTGPWKLVHYVGYEPQLFHLEDDPDELHDRAASEPKVVAELDVKLRAELDVDAIDAEAKAYDRASFSTWRELVGEQEYRKTILHHFPSWSDAELRQLDQWLTGAPTEPHAVGT